MQVMREGRLKPADVAHVTARVHQAAIDVLGPVTDPQTVHQAKFSMGSVLALVATRASAGMFDFERFFAAPETKDFAQKVTMAFDPEVQAAYPERWIGKVEVETVDGRRLAGTRGRTQGRPRKHAVARRTRSQSARAGGILPFAPLRRK